MEVGDSVLPAQRESSILALSNMLMLISGVSDIWTSEAN